MKFKKSFFLCIGLTFTLNLFAHTAYYIAPFCIGVGFTGAFSWSVFRKPNRKQITRESVNPVVLSAIPKSTERVHDTLEKAILAYKAREDLNLTLPLSKTDNLTITRTIPTSKKDPVWLVVPGYKGQRPQKYKKSDFVDKNITHTEVQQTNTTTLYQKTTSNTDSSLHEASTLVFAAHIPSTCVTFEFDDDRRSFNFGQKGDLARLSLIYEELAQTHELVLFGSCRGGTTVLNLLSNPDTPYKNSIKALVLESPSLSLAKLSEHVGKNYLGWMPRSGSIIHTFFRTWFPNYNAHFPSCLNQLINIPHDLPILIGHVENDKVIAWSEIHDLVKGLVETGHNHVYLARIIDPAITHARLNTNEQFRNVLNAFLAHYKLPHNAEKAHAGVELLKIARQEALRVAHEEK